MRIHRIAAAIAVAFPLGLAAQNAPAPVKELGVVTIVANRPTSLPTQIPTTTESISREQIGESINATDSEDALKYFPSLLVRKRYIGDYNHAILSSRASGTGNSARSAVYADGILLSNYLGNGVGGLSFPPRWGLVTPEEIERVDVMYGPFSAAYPGNSVGAVVDYVTRMPTQLEGHASIGYVWQPFKLYGTKDTFPAWQASTSIGSKAGDWTWWFNVNRTDSQGQPLTFARRFVSTTTSTPGTPVTGAVPERDPTNAPIYYIAAQTQYHTIQDHAKVKLAYDITPVLRAAYVFGAWQNTSTNRPTSYLSNAAGAPVTSGPININGANYAAVTGADLPLTDESLTHYMHGFSLKSHTQGTWDWEIAASLYDYAKDQKRQNALANTPPGAESGGPGTIADGGGTGWNTLAARGTWRPAGTKGPHIVDFGVQQDSWKLSYLTSAIPGNWRSDPGGAVASDVGGRTQLQSLWAQDSWRFAPDWKTVLGLRAEHWTAYNGHTQINSTVNTAWPQRSEDDLSPKAAISWQWRDDTVLKASLGRAVRYPTVAELYGATSTVNAQFINDPNLRPERSWTGELSGEKDVGVGLLRLTFFAEDTRDALYSQTTFDAQANRNVSRVSNVGRIATQGLELAFSGADVAIKGLDLSGGVTFAHSIIKENAGFVSVPGDTIGKRQPNIPRWRANALAAYHWTPTLSTSIGARYSSDQFRTLDNSDVNGFTYMGVSRYFVVDLRAQWKATKHLTASFGIDNVNNDKYWNFHPYPQRSYVAELKADF
ncbi:TonB-dependent receptor [Ramlibacter solisilvae]|uniref:TonB-dependent receptor n=1 Tax=Ramlibacter tataouinensis TaxID=94132 RepID=A0A127JU21_9BURK|nr:TonB-dependent receptor [Ramlibacter tataouinensis]AMO23467.1 TonB-dependent receptor [Ramlibacter tataouinensis]